MDTECWNWELASGEHIEALDCLVVVDLCVTRVFKVSVKSRTEDLKVSLMSS